MKKVIIILVILIIALAATLRLSFLERFTKREHF